MKKLIQFIWLKFKNTSLGFLVRKLSPQWLVNLLEHLSLAILANIVYGFPSRKINVIGVTGTDGKTTTANMIYQVLNSAGKKAALVSTINAIIGEEEIDTGFHVTSPHSFTVQEFIQKAVKEGCEFIVLEVTSHALDQHRFWGVKFKLGVITNVTHEHLDYHKTIHKYRLAKAKLIHNSALAVLNNDDGSFSMLKDQAGGKVVTFGLESGADFNPKTFPLKLKISGKFNVLNGLAAAAAASSLGIPTIKIRESLERFKGLPGRLEEIENSLGVKVVVDFAHTPNALENALKTLRKETHGNLISVFGCPSERDDSKRPVMGRISAELADKTILTDEDPRFEDRDKIINEIAQSALSYGAIEGKSLFREPDRQKAIKLALKISRKGDTIGIFGKGHEKSMNYRGVEKPWSDQQAVREALKSTK